MVSLTTDLVSSIHHGAHVRAQVKRKSMKVQHHWVRRPSICTCATSTTSSGATRLSSSTRAQGGQTCSHAGWRASIRQAEAGFAVWSALSHGACDVLLAVCAWPQHRINGYAPMMGAQAMLVECRVDKCRVDVAHDRSSMHVLMLSMTYKVPMASPQRCIFRLWKQRRACLWSPTLLRKPASRSSVSSATTCALPA